MKAISHGHSDRGETTSPAYTGGCICGAVRFDIRDDPVAMNDCQCRHCQQRSGTGHGSYITFASRRTAKLTGPSKHWEAVGAGGTVKHYVFCADCGAPVYLTFPAMPDLVIVHAAALDDPSRYRPQFVLYAASAQPWDPVAPSVQRFDRMPPAG